MCDQALDPNEILSHEFDYAAQTAFQAHEDRVTVFNYYLVTAGTLITAVVLADLTDHAHLATFGLLSGGLAVLGLVSLLKLAKLRLAWIDSVRAMCQIKVYYIQRCGDESLAQAFRWTMETVPSAGKRWTVAFLLALAITFLSSTSAGGAVFCFGLIATGRALFKQSVLVSLLVMAGQLALWFRLCRD